MDVCKGEFVDGSKRNSLSVCFKVLPPALYLSKTSLGGLFTYFSTIQVAVN